MKVKVGSTTYEVIKDLHQAEEDRCGVTYKQLSVIKISPNLSPDIHRETLLHEVLHAISAHVGIDDSDQLTEEQWISRISPMLLTVLSENEELCNALCLA